MSNARQSLGNVQRGLLALVMMLPCAIPAQSNDELLSLLERSLQDSRRAMDDMSSTVVIDDPYARSDMSERAKVAGVYSFASARDTVRLERTFPETSSSGLSYTLVQGHIWQDGKLYEYSRAQETPDAKYTVLLQERDIPFPHPRMVVEYAGISFESLLADGRIEDIKLDGDRDFVVVRGAFEGRPFTLRFDKNSERWTLREASVQCERNQGKFFFNLSVSRWSQLPNGLFVPVSAHVSFGDENNSNVDLGRSFVASEWRALQSEIGPTTRISQGSLVKTIGGKRYTFGASGELVPIAKVSRNDFDPWVMVYFLSGAGLVFSCSFFIAKWIRRQRVGE